AAPDHHPKRWQRSGGLDSGDGSWGHGDHGKPGIGSFGQGNDSGPPPGAEGGGGAAPVRGSSIQGDCPDYRSQHKHFPGSNALCLDQPPAHGGGKGIGIAIVLIAWRKRRANSLRFSYHCFMDPLPLFFHPDREGEGAHFWLEESTARHVAQVLRMGPGQRIRLTDGQGQEAAARIREARKAKVEVQIESLIHHPRPEPRIQLAIGFTRNAARNEWLLEKATELGVQDLIPLKTARALPWTSRPPRWTQILRSALIQSVQ